MKRLTYLLILILINSALYSATLQNSILQVDIDIVGNIKIKSVEGDKKTSTDNQKDILNNKKFGSSFILVSVDGKLAKFSTAAGKNLGTTKKVGDELVTKWKFKEIVFTQKVSLYKSPNYDKKNLIRLAVYIKNTSQNSKKVGVRIVLDTKFGESDESAVFVPGVGRVVKGILINKDQNIPNVLFASDGIIKGTSSLEINFYGKNLVRPDRVYIGKEEYIKKESVFNIKADDDFMDSFKGESAISLNWNPKTFNAGAEDGVAVAIGVGLPEKQEGNPMNIALISPSRVTEKYFWVSALVENSDKNRSITDIKVKLKYDKNYFKLLKGRLSQSYTKLKRHQKFIAYWKFKPLRYGESKMSVSIKGEFRSVNKSGYLTKKIKIQKQ